MNLIRDFDGLGLSEMAYLKLILKHDGDIRCFDRHTPFYEALAKRHMLVWDDDRERYVILPGGLEWLEFNGVDVDLDTKLLALVVMTARLAVVLDMFMDYDARRRRVKR